MTNIIEQGKAYRSVIDGRILYYSFLAGANELLKNQIEINRINVFPVNDKDTGSNLASTVRCVLDRIRPHKSYKTTVKDIAQAALYGARGNSGAIFAQFLYGLDCETQDKEEIGISDFTESVRKSIPYIYKSISNPVEGTMLTVIREWSEFLYSKKDIIDNFNELMNSSCSVLDRSLSETTEKLEALRKTGYVDAGAKGFVLFIKGISDYVRTGKRTRISNESQTTAIHDDNKYNANNNIRFRYCTEAIIKNLSVDVAVAQKNLREYGDSIVVTGDNTTCHIHVHTNYPENVISSLRQYSTISFQKVDDMLLQNERAVSLKWKIALVTDSTCDLSQELIDFYQINVVPLNLNFGENHFLDKVTIKPEKFYDMLESEKSFPVTSQINEQTFLNLYSNLLAVYDVVISIHLTSYFSGTFRNSEKAAKRISQELNKPIYVIDSKNLSGALGLLVLKAAKAIEAGCTVESVVETINEDIKRTKIFVSVKNLKYMIKGGRVSRPKGFIASLFGYNPVVSMAENGKSMLFGNTFSQHSSLKKIISHIECLNKENDIWNYIILHAHNKELADSVENKMRVISNKKAVSIVDISPVIGMHAGNGAVAISLLLTNKSTP